MCTLDQLEKGDIDLVPHRTSNRIYVQLLHVPPLTPLLFELVPGMGCICWIKECVLLTRWEIWKMESLFLASLTCLFYEWTTPWSIYPNEKCEDGLIVIGDLPRWKMWSGLIVMSDLPKWKIKSDLIIMGDLPRKTGEKWSHCYEWPTQVEDKKRYHCNGRPIQLENKKRSHYNRRPTQMIECDLPGKKTWLEKS